MVKPPRFGPLMALAVMGLLAACESAPESESGHFYAMGTRVEFTVRGEATARQLAGEQLQARLEEWHPRWDAWGDGELGRLNQALNEQATAPVAETLRPGLRRALALAEQSQGLFHPGMGALVEHWHFHRQPRPEDLPPPSEATIRQALNALPPIHALNLEGDTFKSPAAGLQLDLGGFIKGFSLDQLKNEWREFGLEGGIINLGGDILALGNAGGRPWQVGVLDPRGPDVLGAITLEDGECIITSGDYERDFSHQDKHYHHLLDPRTGRPARHSASATVVSRDCARADAAATALFIAGPQAWPSIAQTMAVETVMIVTPGGQVELSPSMAERIEFQDREPLSVMRELP